MCLDKLESFKPCKEGWKVFRKKNGKLYSADQNSGKEIIIGKWLDEVNYRGDDYSVFDCMKIKFGRIFGIVDKMPYYLDEEYKYEMGFHVFHERNGAEGWKDDKKRTNKTENDVVMKVAVKKPVATGYQYGHKITVARKIMVVKGD